MAKHKESEGSGTLTINLFVEVDLGASLDPREAFEFANELIEKAREQGTVSGKIHLSESWMMIS